MAASRSIVFRPAGWFGLRICHRKVRARSTPGATGLRRDTEPYAPVEPEASHPIQRLNSSAQPPHPATPGRLQGKPAPFAPAVPVPIATVHLTFNRGTLGADSTGVLATMPRLKCCSAQASALNEVRPNPSLEATPTGGATWPFQGQSYHCPFQGQAAPPPGSPQLKR